MISLLVAVLLAQDGGAPETVVSATRDARPSRDVPMTVIVIPRAELERNPAATMDGVLRAEPSVATFRRNVSFVADPTAQGVNLRGVGPSGVSRALVLLDGVPQNDPFGGWVFWRSLPRLGLERVEVMPGPGSSLYGSAALGGVVSLISRAPDVSGLDAELSGGNLGTVEGAARGAYAWANGGAVVEAGGLHTDGYPIVRPPGAVDGPAGGDDFDASARVEVRPSDDLRLGLRVFGFSQNQNGGTSFTDSHAHLYGVSGTSAWTPAGGGALRFTLFARGGEFDQRRARLAADRSSEKLAGQQTVPFEDEGAGGEYVLPPLDGAGVHTFTLGVDVRRAQGLSHETIFLPDGALAFRDAGGAQLFGGVFVQDVVELTRHLQLLASVRGDAWQNRTTIEGVDDRTEGQVSPRAGALVRPVDWLAFRVSGGSGFRAPTLNELYRPFQVGTVLTAANEALVAERLYGAEAGVEVTPSPVLGARVTGFWNRLENPVTNVTLAGGTRQRQNLGAARIQGVEASVQSRLFRRFIALAAYTYVDARVVEAGATGLSGKRLAQDPEHRGTASLTFDDPRFVTVTTELRVTGPQFEDDLNTLPMGGFAVVNVSASRRLGWGFEAFGAIENLLDRRYVVGRAGVDTYGQPLMGRVGLRYRSL